MTLNTNIPTMKSIMIWGPPGSGKSSLIQAFPKELEYYSRHDSHFDYQLMDEEGQFIRPIFSHIAPTDQPEDYYLTFTRKPKSDLTKYSRNAHVHRILIQDNRGRSTVELSDPMSEASLLFSDYLILLLDPTDPNPHEAYERYFEVLFTSESFRKSKTPRYIAFCISKIDLLNRKGPPFELATSIFGNTFATRFYALRSISNAKLETFSLSSFGFYRSRDGLKSNFNPETGSLINIDQWRPYNIAAPFFWLFENIEREKLASLKRFFYDPQKDYISYPRLRDL